MPGVYHTRGGSNEDVFSLPFKSAFGSCQVWLGLRIGRGDLSS